MRRQLDIQLCVLGVALAGLVTAATLAISTVAGTGTGGYDGDGGPATLAEIEEPHDVAVDSSGHYFIADKKNDVIRRVDGTTGVISTYAGTGSGGYSGDGGLATAAKLDDPEGIACDSSDNLYIADKKNNVIRKVDAFTGVISTVVGTGSDGYSGDGGAATAAKLDEPKSVACDASDNLYIADKGNDVIRKVDTFTGIITTLAGTGSGGYSGDDGPATSAKLDDPEGVACDADGNVYIADKKNDVVRRVDGATGIITTFAGTGSAGFSGDGGLAISADLDDPVDVACDVAGNVYIADKKNSVVRKVDVSSGIITTVAGFSAAAAADDDGIPDELSEPQGVAIGPNGRLYIADKKNDVVRMTDANLRVITWQEVDPSGSP